MRILKENMGDMPTVLPKDHLMASLNGLYENGLPKGLYTEIDSLDEVCRLDKGRLLTITGVPNYGKSEFVDFLTCTYNKRYGFKTLYFSPENQPVNLHIAKLVSKFIGRKFDKKEISSDEIQKAGSYILDNFFFFNYEKVKTLDNILAEAERMVNDKGIDILVLDAYNKIESELPNGVLETNFISKILDGLSNFAIRNNVLVILVAHPRKMEKDGDGYKCPSAYDINGSANFYNKSDFVLVVHRDFKKEDVIIKVDKVKFSNYGCAGGNKTVRLKYDCVSGNYYQDNSNGAYVEDDESVSYTSTSFAFPEMTLSDPLDVEVSLYQNVEDKIGTTANLKEVLLSDDYKEIVEKIRQGSTPEERHNIKALYKKSIPCFTVAGTFNKRKAKEILKNSGLMGIDIDYKDNVEIMSKVPEILKGLPYITFYSKSISGDGYFAITKLGNPKNYLGHFLALEEEFKGYGITIDTACKDVSRLRFVSYDMEAYCNPSATAYYKEKSEYESTPTQPMPSMMNYVGKISSTPTSHIPFSNATATETIDKLIDRFESSGGCLPDDYISWYNMAMSLASLGETGRSYFHRLSARSSKYDSQKCDEQFDRALDYGASNCYTAGTVIMMLKDAMGGAQNHVQ